MNERTRLTPGDEEHGEWIECQMSLMDNYLLELVYKGKVEDVFRLYPDEVLALSLLHPDIKRLVAWAKIIIGHENQTLENADAWNEGKKVLIPFEEKK